jgi:prepilin-type N-terminal cleavage/methylation domain-containing protein
MASVEDPVCSRVMSRARQRQRGFTLVEVMIVAALIAILVAIAIPVFTSTSRKAKGESEVGTYFQDFRTRMEQYQQENGVYPPTLGEGSFHPATPGAQKQTIFPMLPEWTEIRLRPSGSTDVYCGYTWASGLPNDAANVGAIAAAAAPNGFGFVVPATNWYYVLAKCNLDGVGAFSYYFTSSVDTSIRKLNEGN